MKKTWFITGASRGFGRIWAEAALQRGDKVTATARRLEDIVDFKERFGDAVLPMALDVTNSEQVPQVKHFGRLDVLVNNAGKILFAATEEASDEQMRDLFDANYVGKRAHPWRFERSWDYGAAAHRFLLRHEMGSGGYARITGAGGETLRHQGHTG